MTPPRSQSQRDGPVALASMIREILEQVDRGAFHEAREAMQELRPSSRSGRGGPLLLGVQRSLDGALEALQEPVKSPVAARAALLVALEVTAYVVAAAPAPLPGPAE